KDEFSEWDLTVAAWSFDRLRFGLRGYAESYPDHKRVMMEIMGKKTSSPIMQQYMTKVRPNYYRMTSLGRAVAARIRGGGPPPSPSATCPTCSTSSRRWPTASRTCSRRRPASSRSGSGTTDPLAPRGRREPHPRGRRVVGVGLDADPLAPQPLGDRPGRVAAGE